MQVYELQSNILDLMSKSKRVFKMSCSRDVSTEISLKLLDEAKAYASSTIREIQNLQTKLSDQVWTMPEGDATDA